jgi:hypothetical protein
MLSGTSILAVPVGTVIHQVTFRVGRMCSWPMLHAPATVSGVHSAVELTGSRLVLGHFSDTSLVLRPLFAQTVSCRHRPSSGRHGQRPDPLKHRPEQASGQVALGQQQPVVAGVRANSDSSAKVEASPQPAAQPTF